MSQDAGRASTRVAREPRKGLATIERVVAEGTPADVLRGKLRRDLKVALKERRSVEVAALRMAIASVDNAEAVDVAGLSVRRAMADPDAPIAGAVVGAAAGDVRRRALSPADLQRVLDEEIAVLREQAADYETLGRDAEATAAHAQAEVIARHRAALG